MTTAPNPTVSIIIPAFNTAPFIDETLRSVFAQTYADFEVIVINDGSPDTKELESVLEAYLPRIIYLKQANRGSGGARNTGIHHARGEYLAFLDSDDAWLPDFLACQMKLLSETPSLDVVYCDAEYFGNRALHGKTFMQNCPSKGQVTLENLIREDCQVLFSCSVARRKVMEHAGLFDETLRCCEDYDLWLRVVYCGGHIGYHNRVLGRHRYRSDSLSRGGMNVPQTMLNIYKKSERTMKLSRETSAVLQKRIEQAQAELDLEAGRAFIAARDFQRARDSFRNANHFYRRTRLKMTILGLQIAPDWTRSAVITWQKAISDRS